MERRRILATFAVAALGFLPVGAARADTSLEYDVKAAYLVKFIPFIDWPAAAFASPAQPVTICVLGDDPFGGKLDAMAGQKSGDRTVAVKHVAPADSQADCQLLFLGKTAAPDALAAVKDKPVLTVTDSDQSGRGIISFVLADNHVRFDIDDAAAQADGLKISSKLLELAHAVRRKASP